MFNKCTSLQVAPELPATCLTDGCYYCMFGQCKQLEYAPQLPALSLSKDSYGYMFYGCTNLKYINVNTAVIGYKKFTGNWVLDVGTEGTIIINPNADRIFNVHGIPKGWKVVESSD